jgi:hypothetical protein
MNSMLRASHRLDAIWSMIPQLTRANSISARWAIRASRTSSRSRSSSWRNARSMATSSAADDDRPAPTGRSVATNARSGGTATPSRSSSRMQPSR